MLAHTGNRRAARKPSAIIAMSLAELRIKSPV